MVIAAAYIRVSTEEQKEKGYSLQDQIHRIKQYCIQKGFDLLPEYEDDYSGKNFSGRSGFNRFLQDVKSKGIKVNMLIVTKIDRFSRDVNDTMFMVKRLNLLGIKVFSLSEGEIDFNNPHSFFTNLIQSGAAQYDNLMRADNTIRGMRQAQKEGRWVSTAPFGYKNDKINKLIIVDDVNAEIVKKAFSLFSTGLYSAEEVRKSLRSDGLKLHKQSFLTMLRNPAYIGKVKVKSYKEQVEEIVQGVHQPLITEDEFNAVQRVLRGCRNTSSKGGSKKESLPLRGFLYCNICSKKLTGSASTSRNKTKHHYYHCQNGCKERFRANEANEAFIDYLKAFEISEPVKVLYKSILEDVFVRDDEDRKTQKSKIEKELLVVNDRINSITDKFADGDLAIEIFKNTSSRYEATKFDLQLKLDCLAPEMASYKKHVSFSLLLIENLSQFYKNGDLAIKQKIVGSIFNEKLVFDRKNYRTTEMNEVIRLLCSWDKDFSRKAKKKVSNFADQSCKAPQSGLEPETL